MFIKNNKIKLMMIVIALLILCIVVSVLKHREPILATEASEGTTTIDGRIGTGYSHKSRKIQEHFLMIEQVLDLVMQVNCPKPV